MERRRSVAASPVRTATGAWRIVVQLLADTLERSSNITDGSVTNELQRLYGIAAAMIAAGHLENGGLVLVDEALHLTISVVTGDAALRVEENLNAVPGGGSASSAWVLHLPSPPPYASELERLVESSEHLSLDPAPAPASSESGKAASVVDIDALRRLGARS